MHSRTNVTALRRAEGLRGATLIVALWATVVLSIVLLNFAFLARTHLRIASNYAATNVLQNIAFAGTERAIAEIKQDQGPADHPSESWADNEKEFREAPIGAGRFDLVRDALGENETIAYGLEDEAAKLNLRTATRDMLLRLEGMDEALVDALEDWQDQDSEPKLNGAENEYYGTLPRPYDCKNEKLSTINEILLVKGFDPSVLFGEDLNGNGLLDPGEDDGDASPPRDNRDGVLDRGLLPFVTIYSSDKNVTADGKDRVDINAADEETLRKAIPDLTDVEAKAIVAFRKGKEFEHLGDLLNVTEAPPQQQGGQQGEGQRPPDGGQQGTGPQQGGDSQEQGNNQAGTKTDEKSDSGGSDGSASAQSDTDGKGNASQTGSESATAAGKEANRDGKRGGEQGSPDPGQAQPAGKKIIGPVRLKQIIDYCKIGESEMTDGRININTAPEEVLVALPGVTKELARATIAYRQNPSKAFKNIAEWLDAPGMNESIFIPLSSLITVRSYQFRAKSVARIEGLTAQRTAEAVLDRSGDKVRALYWQEY